MPRLLFLVAATALTFGAHATESSPVGLWKTIDDDTHEAKSIVEIVDHDGVLSGRIVQLLRKPGEDPQPRCTECSGERHNEPVLGMTILWGMQAHGEVWDGGEILDPENGSTYRCKLRALADGKHLEVRGFIGIALFGRSQVWQRAKP